MQMKYYSHQLVFYVMMLYLNGYYRFQQVLKPFAVLRTITTVGDGAEAIFVQCQVLADAVRLLVGGDSLGG